MHNIAHHVHLRQKMEPYTQWKAVCAWRPWFFWMHERVVTARVCWVRSSRSGSGGGERTLGVLPATVSMAKTDSSSLLVYIRATQQGFPRTACLLHRGITQMTQPTQQHFPNRVYLEMLWSFGGKLMNGKLEPHNIASQDWKGRRSLCKKLNPNSLLRSTSGGSEGIGNFSDLCFSAWFWQLRKRTRTMSRWLLCDEAESVSPVSNLHQSAGLALDVCG